MKVVEVVGKGMVVTASGSAETNDVTISQIESQSLQVLSDEDKKCYSCDIFLTLSG
jgi:hypothetical protein